MANRITPPTDEYRGTHIVEESKGVAWEVADFLFGVKSIEKIASGKGTWGDALNVGITAATFFIPPAKLLTFSSKALGKVIVDAEKVAANEAVSEVAKKVALRTAEEAKSIRDTGLSLAENPTRPMSEARFKKITEPEPETGFVPEKPPLDTFESGPAPFRQFSDADEFGWTTKQESKYYGTGSDKTAKEIAEDRFEARTKLKQDDIKPAPKQKLTPEEQAVVDKVNAELPETLTLPEEAGKVTVINRKTGELEFESSMTERTALPSELSISPRVDRAAWLQNQLDKLGRKKNSLPKEKRPEIQYKIDKYDTEFKSLRKKLTEEERVQAGELYNKLNKLDLKEASKTAPKTTRFNLDQSKKDLEKLREQWSNTPAKDFEKRNKLKQEGKTLADRIKKMEKDSGLPTTVDDVSPATSTISSVSDVTVHSGGAKGADTAWAEAADLVGIKTMAHSFKGHESLGTASGFVGKRPALEVRNDLTEEQLRQQTKLVNDAGSVLGKRAGTSSAGGKLVHRNAYQVKDSDAVLAVASGWTKIADETRVTVGGRGTPWAVEMGIILDKPVFVFEQNASKWFKYNPKSKEWDELDGIPPKFKNFAGIGTASELKESGRSAIQEYMQQFDPWNVNNIKPLSSKSTSKSTSTVRLTEDNVDELYESELDALNNDDWTEHNQLLKEISFEQAHESDFSELKDIYNSGDLKPINSFRGESSFLSNMSESSFKFGDETYPTVEHFFQAMKTTNTTERAKILAAKTAGEAKKIGRTVTLRSNWNKIREEVMEAGLRAKFQQNPELKQKLVDTGFADLIEGNTWGDTFWGQVNGKGQNKLGKLLMKIRDELMKGN